MMWNQLPDIILVEIFRLLSLQDRYYCSMVCRYWNSVFYTSKLWRHLRLDERSFTQRRYQVYKGYTYDINHHRFQRYLGQLGHNTRRITFIPITNFFNLFEFLKIVSCFLEFFEEYPMPYLERFDFTFACENRIGSELLIMGTGGQILAELSRLLANLHGLTRLTLNNLLLDVAEAPRLLDAVARNCQETLRYLELLNTTKIKYPIQSIAELKSLRKLVVTPFQIDDRVLLLILKNTKLDELKFIQDRYTPAPCEDDRISIAVWEEAKKYSPSLKVYLEFRGSREQQLLLQVHAPVYSIIFDTPHSKVSSEMILDIIHEYKNTLTVFGHKGVCRMYQPRSFHDRADSFLVMLARQCRHLNTLVIREKVSTATLLVIAAECKSLRNLLVRRNAVILRSDWPRSTGWTEEFYAKLKTASKSYDKVEMEITRRFGHKWKPLSDAEFKNIKL